MAIFGKKNKEQTSAEAQPQTEEKKQSTRADAAPNYARILRRPYITEKAATLSEQNAYTFEVPQDANKKEVAKAVKALYEVTPQKVRMTRIPPKRVMTRRGERGMQPGLKKAVIYLKEGDRIEFV